MERGYRAITQPGASPTPAADNHSGEEERIMDAQNLRAQRKVLAEAEYNTYSPDYFPGSAGWRKNKAAADALKQFDAAHPEIIAALQAERAAERKRSYEALSDFVKGGS
jgi:hypothetical protein